MYVVQYNFTVLSISFRYRGMRFRQLQYFVSVAEELHFGRAAKRLHMSQPPLSQQIRLLEEDLGVRLFDRTSQRVALTREGSFLLREARDVLARLDSARSVLAAMSRGEAGTLRVGYVDAVPMSALVRVMARFHDSHPHVELTTHDQGTVNQFQDLLAGRKELGLVTMTGQTVPQGLAWKALLREHYVLAMPSSHPLADKPGLALADLNGERFIRCSLEGNPPYWTDFERLLARAGLTRLDYKSCCELPMKHGLVAQGAGISILPSSCMRAPLPGVAYHSLADVLPPFEAAAVWHEERLAPVTQKFLGYLEEELDSLGYGPGRCPGIGQTAEVMGA